MLDLWGEARERSQTYTTNSVSVGAVATESGRSDIEARLELSLLLRTDLMRETYLPRPFFGTSILIL